jgi:deazaflavin-dependent oxidoreductase (nitroreductase family)
LGTTQSSQTDTSCKVRDWGGQRKSSIPARQEVSFVQYLDIQSIVLHVAQFLIIIGANIIPQKGGETMATTFQQREQGFMTYPGGGWLKFGVKAPITLWRLGLGPVIGKVLMLITTTGRKSGLPRRTMVEYHTLPAGDLPVSGKKYAPSAFGPKADWYKNIAADPRVTIQTADGAEGAIATRVTDDDELVAVFELFRRRDPVVLNWYLGSLDIQPDPADIVARKDRIYWLRFDPTDEVTPPPLEVDLKWVWLVVLAGWLGFWLGKRTGGD